MRIIYGNFAIAIKFAKCEGKRLVFEDLDGVSYYTDDYFADNIALCQLNDLVINGHIRVKELKVM